jgi:hypothetical protein
MKYKKILLVTGLITSGEKPQYNVFRDYVYQHIENFWQILNKR